MDLSPLKAALADVVAIPVTPFAEDGSTKAIASFERVLVTNASPADCYESLRSFEKALEKMISPTWTTSKIEDPIVQKYVSLTKASKEHPISEAAKRGRDLFFRSKANCTSSMSARISPTRSITTWALASTKEPDFGRVLEGSRR